jgi:conjugal transfer pilus assembly protein TraF
MKKLISLIFGIFFCFVVSPKSSLAAPSGGFEMKDPQGFHWYSVSERQSFQEGRSEKLIKKETKSQTPKSPSRQKGSKTLYTERMKAFQKDLEEAQSRAILNPSYENVRTFKAYQDQVMTRATKFSEMWLMVNLMEGGVREEDNNNLAFRKIYDGQEDQRLDEALKKVAKTHGLFFFFKQDCPYCHQFAPLVDRFAKAYGFEVKAISQEGGQLKEFPESVQDNGMGSKLNPEGIYPSLFIANPKTGEVAPLAWGFVSLADLKRNFKYILTALGDLS